MTYGSPVRKSYGCIAQENLPIHAVKSFLTLRDSSPLLERQTGHNNPRLQMQSLGIHKPAMATAMATAMAAVAVAVAAIASAPAVVAAATFQTLIIPCLRVRECFARL
ncbi:hypothetical protein HZH66_014260 [Vespula vulgaris]|uniref:Uncharacterized protein n=1 Tax=Vespula vulgaris TaxID=7454 RepID=A0A834MRE3_VESVU|nr:hypothetical protein HZH66_014260 [Vespula vulgaris]